MTKFFAHFILMTCVFLTGCGYTTGSNLPSNLKTVYVEPFKNNIVYAKEGKRNVYFPLLEVKVKDAIIDRYLFDGNLKIVDAESADLVLKGELVDYNRYGLRFTDGDVVQEYRVNIVVNMTLWDEAKQEVRWQENGFVGEATYFVSGALAKTESSAVEEATIDLARRIVERTVEDW